jgi:hypothetical protein
MPVTEGHLSKELGEPERRAVIDLQAPVADQPQDALVFLAVSQTRQTVVQSEVRQRLEIPLVCPLPSLDPTEQQAGNPMSKAKARNSANFRVIADFLLGNFRVIAAGARSNWQPLPIWAG